MADLLYLVHRLPYPPDKGDKVRSYHLLRHLAARHRVYLGTFLDDATDEKYVDTVRSLCAGLHVARLYPSLARLRSLSGLIDARPLTLPYYHDASLARWVSETIRREGISRAVVFSSSMAQYVEGRSDIEMLVDFVDVDSAKWRAYGAARPWPLGALYRREGDRLLAYERSVARRAARAFFVTEREAKLFERLAPECAATVEVMGNGVDADYFAADPARESPFAPGEVALVFTGAMDYWPNVDAVTWFAHDVLPALRARHLRLRLHVVGRDPAPAVRALAGDAVAVSGTVPDVRPYLQHAAAVVAPMRLARGVQNKILEAMAMGRPVIASRASAEAIEEAADGVDLLTAADAGDFVRGLDALLTDRSRAEALGATARRRVVASYAWSARLATIDRHLSQASAEVLA